MSSVARFTVSMDHRLMEQFDQLIKKKSYTNRSEAVRDLVRSAMVEEQWEKPGEKVAATVTLIYNHHTRELSDRLNEVQHHHGDGKVP